MDQAPSYTSYGNELDQLHYYQLLTQRVMATVHECLLVLDTHMNILSANQCFYNKFYMDSEEILGTPLFQLNNKEWDIPLLRTALTKMSVDSFPFQDLEIEHDFPKLGKRVMLMSAQEISWNSDEKRRILLTIADITDEKDLTRRKDDFISMAAHELKTPLTSLRAYNQIIQSLLKKNSSESALLYTHKMQVQFDRLNKLIFDLLDVSRIGSGTLDLSESTFYLDEIVRDVATTLQPAFPSHLIYIYGRTDFHVKGDLDRIGQVVTNFITNAIKYSPQSDHIVISLETERDMNSLHVQDFGVGIDKKHQPRIFERYYRVNDENDKKYAGLGIGLYVCSQIIKRQGGRIWVDSNPGQGSTFSFALPTYDKYEFQNFGCG